MDFLGVRALPSTAMDVKPRDADVVRHEAAPGAIGDVSVAFEENGATVVITLTSFTGRIVLQRDHRSTLGV